MPESLRSFREVGVTSDVKTVATTTSSATTLQELITTIPRAYQPLLGEFLTKIYRISHKLANVQSTVTLYERHQTDGSFPPIVRNSLKEPRLQFAKEFLATQTGAQQPQDFHAAVVSARRAVLLAAIKSKKEELKELGELARPNEEDWLTRCLQVARSIAESNGGKMERADGKLRFEGLPTTAHNEYTLLSQSCAVYSYRAQALARTTVDRAELQKLSKLKLKETTDVEMTDVGQEKSTREIIREEQKAFESRLLAKIGSCPPAQKRTFDQLISTTSPSKRQKVQRSQDTDQRCQESEGQWQKEALAKKEISIDAFMREAGKRFRPWLPESYPSVYLSLSDRCRMKIAFSFLKCWEADSIRTAKPGIFKHPDVFIPEDIEYMLAVNHKYILHNRPENHDVHDAKTRFARTVRVKWQFRNHDRQNQEFIPKFHVPNPFWEPQKASPAIESGIEAAMEEIDRQVGQALSRVVSSAPKQRNLDWTRVQDFLVSNRLLVKLTDKNLGIAVFPADWYTHEVMKMLADGKTYQMVPPVDEEQLFDTLIDKLSKWKLPKNMERFVEEKTTTKVPVFHAIPKVHKNPWKLRPIVPSHSWVTSRLSEVVDHLCRPMLTQLPWVVGSTKEVIAQIEEVRTDWDDVWIVTGDVVAFYTNIDATECAKVVSGGWQRYMPNSKIHARHLRQMITFIMENNYFRFQNQTWKQLDGLAMGTAAAPVLANIYAGYLERHNRIPFQPGVLKYMRYIDDVLMLFKGTEKDLTEFIANYKLGPLTVEWSYSQLKNEFLDVEIMRTRDLRGSKLVTRLFKKHMNKHLYIPWSSAHPSHVKKAFVKAELIRFAIVSSEVEYFADARRQFYGNLRRRGYPAQVLSDWFTQVSYQQRALFLMREKHRENEAPLMLSGQYNPVWECINVDEILRSARRAWNLERELPDALQQPLIRSLRRYTSLSDLFSTWNKTILHPDMQRTENEQTDTDWGTVAASGYEVGSLPVRGVPGKREAESGLVQASWKVTKS